MWGHSESLVREVEFKLFVVLVFLVFGIANVSNYSKRRPKFVLSFSPLWSLFFVSKSSKNGPKSYAHHGPKWSHLGAKMIIGPPPKKHEISGSSLNGPKATLERPLDGFGAQRRGQGSSLGRQNVPKTS